MGSPQRTAPKSKAQVVAELAPKLQKPGTTPGRAAIAAEQTYADAEKRFGSNAQTVLEMLQPGQDSRRFLDGFQNAYILGKQGNHAALDRSSAAAYLTGAQRQRAYDMGEGSLQRNSAEIGSRSGSTASQGKKTDLLSVLKNGTIEEKKAAFRKAFQEGLISTRISPQKQARHIWGTKQFQEYDAKLSIRGEHPSYLCKDLSENDLRDIVIPKLRGDIRGDGGRFYEYIDCDRTIGFYYSRTAGEYLETNRVQVVYAVEGRNIHIFPVKRM